MVACAAKLALCKHAADSCVSCTRRVGRWWGELLNGLIADRIENSAQNKVMPPISPGTMAALLYTALEVHPSGIPLAQRTHTHARYARHAIANHSFLRMVLDRPRHWWLHPAAARVFPLAAAALLCLCLLLELLPMEEWRCGCNAAATVAATSLITYQRSKPAQSRLSQGRTPRPPDRAARRLNCS